MATFQQHLRKLILERAAAAQTSSHDAPPPYTPTAIGGNYSRPTQPLYHGLGQDSDDDDEEEDDEDPSPITLTLNAGTFIKGNNNVVSASNLVLADATRFSALLSAAVQQLSTKIEEEAVLFGEGRRSGISVNLVINAGVTIMGDGNVIGVATERAAGSTAGGNARKRTRTEDGDDDDVDESREAKRMSEI